MKATGVSKDWTLPRGRHRLPREFVASHQRTRLLEAATGEIAKHGYASLTVAHIIQAAGISRRTFYEQFDNLQECVYAAYEASFERLTRIVFDACASHEDWPEGLAAAVSAAVDFAANSPQQAHLLVAANSAGDPQLTRRALATREQFVGMLRAGRERCPEAAATTDLVEQALIGGVMSVVGDRLIANQTDRLPELKPELVQLLLTPYVGGAEARRVASAA